jgi:perosamine synthetase
MLRMKYPIAQPDISRVEMGWVMEALAECELSGHGKHVRMFEEKFAEFIGTRYCLAAPNGTITLHLILVALGVGPGDEVILPSQTISNCAFAVSLTGATVVAVDIDKDTWCMDPIEMKKAVTSKTKAVMPTHLYGGIPCNMRLIKEILDEYKDVTGRKVWIIEDCAESIGSSVDSSPVEFGDEFKMTGSIGDVASFSFFANKTLMTGEGGAITTSDKILYEKMKYLRNVAYGTDPETKFWANDMGFNYRPSNLICALGLGQLERIGYLMERRNEIHSYYEQFLDNRYVFQTVPEYAQPCYWMNAVLCPSNRSKIMKTLAERYGVETRPTFPPIGSHPYLKKSGLVRSCGEKVSEDVWNRGLLFPSAGKHLTRESVKEICGCANMCLDEFCKE